jgi:hypothetical protein
VKEIPYFVSDSFLRTYHRDRYQLGQVERMVERAYEQFLVDECSKQQSYKKRLLKSAAQESDQEEQALKQKQATEFELTRCGELTDLYPQRNGRR